jgi:hypothetical protein
MGLFSQPRAWATIFISNKDCRSFIEMCLERSQPVTLEVVVDASEEGRFHAECSCDEDTRGRLVPNESDPCEWHFQFESLAEAGHSKRVHELNIDFEGRGIPLAEKVRLALGSCQFFTLSFPHLTSLEWMESRTEHGNYIFSTPPFPHTLRFLSFMGSWDGSVTQVNNLISFTFENEEIISLEAIRLFILNNRSLESLSLKYATFEGTSRGSPVSLFNLKSFNVGFYVKGLSTIIRIPALQRLSSLWISMDDDNDDQFILRATGDGITLSTKSDLSDIMEVWQDLTGYARPTIRHIRLYDDADVGPHDGGDGVTVAALLTDAHTLEIGEGYWASWYNGFVDDLKQLGPQLTTIRFAVSDEHEPFQGRGDEYEEWGGGELDRIEELVKYRYEQGRPFSTVERMVVSGSERTNRQQDYVWRCFYGSRKLGQYVRPG